jgi:hypothetical protein
MKKIEPPSITYTLSVSVTVALNEDFTDENAEARDTQRDIEKSVYRHLETWGRANHCPVYKPTVDVELTDYDITMPNPREKGDDDGSEYAHPGDYRAGRE